MGQNAVRFAVNTWDVVRMDKANSETRNKLKGITSVKEFESILEQTMLSDEDKQILRMHYKEQKSLSYIADIIGMSETTIKKKHRKALMKLGTYFRECN